MASSILLHEILNICNQGTDYISRCVAPVFGLKLDRLTLSLTHILLVTLSTLLACTADERFLLPLFLVLTVVILSYSIRLPNHLMVAWFFFLLLSVDFWQHGSVTENGIVGVRFLVILTYAFAGFHKLNRDYYSPSSSCGVQLLKFYFKGRLAESLLIRLAVPAGIWIPSIGEIAIAILLSFNYTQTAGVILAILLQALFGFTRNAHFSVLMYGGLALFLPDSTTPTYVILLSCFLGPYIALRYCMWKVYPWQRLALLAHIGFGGLTVYMTGWAISTIGLVQESYNFTVDWWVAIAILFALNAASPYYSSKTEFSLAMFSNIRHDRGAHFLIRRNRCCALNNSQYVELLSVRGLPDINNYPRASLTYRLLRSLNLYRTRKYSKYFLVESFCMLKRDLKSDFLIEISDGQGRQQFSSTEDLARLSYRKLCLTPTALPIDNRSPYCG